MKKLLTFFLIISFSVSALTCTNSNTSSSNKSSTEGKITTYAGSFPIADVHFHPHPSIHPSKTLEKINDNHVDWLASGELKGGKKVRDEYKAFLKERYLPLGGQSDFNKIFFKDGEEALEDINNPLFKKKFQN